MTPKLVRQEVPFLISTTSIFPYVWVERWRGEGEREVTVPYLPM